jgi:hypothetical protein
MAASYPAFAQRKAGQEIAQLPTLLTGPVADQPKQRTLL